MIFNYIQQIIEYLITKDNFLFSSSNIFDAGMNTDSRETAQHLLLSRDSVNQKSSTRYDGFKAKQVGDSSTKASEAHPVKQNNPLPVLWSLGGALGYSSVWTGLSRARTRRGLPKAMQHTKARMHAYPHIHAHVNSPRNIWSLWRNISAHWQKEIIHENARVIKCDEYLWLMPSI